jgi:hypothetical protein
MTSFQGEQMDKINRQQQLVLEIAKYMSDWLEEPEES